MNFVQVEGLTKSYGERVLFENISFGLQLGQKTALVAKNGAGKSTLLRIMMDKDVADAGQVVFRNDCVVAYLDQNPYFNPEDTIREAVFAWKDPRIDAIREYELILEQAESPERN